MGIINKVKYYFDSTKQYGDKMSIEACEAIIESDFNNNVGKKRLMFLIIIVIFVRCICINDQNDY